MKCYAALTISCLIICGGCGKLPNELAAEGAQRAEQAKVAASKASQDRLLQNVKSRFKDPDSVKFLYLNLVKYLDGDALCGYVNAKNGFGGYVGYRLFVVSDTPLKLNSEQVMIADGGMIGFYGTYAGADEVGCGVWILEHGGQNPQ